MAASPLGPDEDSGGTLHDRLVHNWLKVYPHEGGLSETRGQFIAHHAGTESLEVELCLLYVTKVWGKNTES